MKILFITSRVPYPLEKGDKLRAFNQLKLLGEIHEVTLVALTDGEVHPDAVAVLRRFCKHVFILRVTNFWRFISLATAAVGKTPFSTAYFSSVSNIIDVEDIVEQIQPAHIICQLTRTARYVDYVKDIPRTLDYQDAFAEGFRKRIDKEPFYLRWLFKMEYKRLKAYENYVFSKFDNKIIISEQDRANIDHPEKDKIVIVPNGVDFEYYHPRTSEKKYDLLFTGNMAYPPNIESVVFLVKEVLPLVIKHKPQIKLLIAGTDPVKRVLALESNNVAVSGWVDDMRDCYAASKLFIAPMQISIGLQNKLLEAMAMNIPCITSELANNALHGTHNQNILVCRQPQEYAEAILRLLDNPAEAEQIANAGNEFVKQNYGWKKMTEPLFEILSK